MLAKLVMKNFLFTKNKLSAAFFDEFWSDWSKKLLGSKDFVRGHKVQTSIIACTQTLGQ